MNRLNTRKSHSDPRRKPAHAGASSMNKTRAGIIVAYVTKPFHSDFGFPFTAEGNILYILEDVYSQARARTYCLWIRFEFMAAEKRTAAENEEEQTIRPGRQPAPPYEDMRRTPCYQNHLPA